MESIYLELQEMPVLRVRADMKGKGPSAAFDLLESKLSTFERSQVLRHLSAHA